MKSDVKQSASISSVTSVKFATGSRKSLFPQLRMEMEKAKPKEIPKKDIPKEDKHYI
ncbi:hypothetical protein RND71_032519 [Anisodus tanguticus]|uniref:Uncharacterized protein n=1 Tax=Anisodus tanguticus TaxID=243964 RepID=A0AAE1V327_9SOLA|nr:hypothetical protein RND71_032519 [Anisodus tanguticus]